MTIAERLKRCVGFQWDAGNSEKNWIKHGVSRAESEEAFDNLPLILSEDEMHSGEEERFHAMGQTDRGKRLFITFTFREDILIRVISARPMDEYERNDYDYE
ncbi:MAG: BrnT family toxin [Candidatus Kapaibacterium sp.]